MRIVGGRFKGRQVPLKAEFARPTSDKVREALFSILYDRIEDARCLDLFTGSGCIGLEALSRGAAHVVFADKDRRAIAALRENLERFGVEKDRFTALIGPYEAVARELCDKGERFDFIYLDPPYDAGYYESALTWADRLVKDTGIVVAEHRHGTELPERVGSLARLRERKYGTQVIALYTKEDA